MPIGVEVGVDGVKLLQVRQGRSGMCVHAFGRASLGDRRDTLDDPATLEALTGALREQAEGGRFSTRRCVLGLENAMLRVRSTRQPKMPRAEAERAIRLEAAERLGFSPGEAEIDWLRAGQVRHGEEMREEVILIGSQRERIEGVVNAVIDAGLRPVAVEPAFIASARAFSRELDPVQATSLVRLMVDIGRRSSTVMVLRGGEIAFYKPLDIGGDELNRVAAERLGLDLDTIIDLRRQRKQASWSGGESSSAPKVDRAIFDAVRPLLAQLAEEVSLCLRYYTVTFCGQRPSHALVVGSEAAEPGLIDALQSALSVQTQIGRPLDGVDHGPLGHGEDADAPHCEWSVAFGLGLRAVEQQGARRAAA